MVPKHFETVVQVRTHTVVRFVEEPCTTEPKPRTKRTFEELGDRLHFLMCSFAATKSQSETSYPPNLAGTWHDCQDQNGIGWQR